MEDGVNLEYFTDESLQEYKGSYSINSCVHLKFSFIEGPTDFVFVLEDTRRKKAVYLAADSESIRGQWIEDLTDVVYALRQYCQELVGDLTKVPHQTESITGTADVHVASLASTTPATSISGVVCEETQKQGAQTK